MQMMASFVADAVPISALTEEQITNTLDFTWVHRWTRMDIRSRLCVRGIKQWIKGLDDTFATPVPMFLKLLLVLADSTEWSIVYI